MGLNWTYKDNDFTEDLIGDNLERIPLTELEHNNKEGIYEQVRQAIKPIVNYNWDNDILRVSNIFGDEFSISIHLCKFKDVPSGWEINVWDYKGSSAIGRWTKKYVNKDDKLDREMIRDMKKRTWPCWISSASMQS